MTTPGLLIPSPAYKPFRYPWAYDFWKKQQQVHWMPEEVPLGEDCKDWAAKLNDGERNLLTQIFRFFTQSDVEVNDNYMERYARVFKPTEVKMMLSAFSNMETIHIAAYALLLETIGMPESEFGAFLEYQAMRDKHDYMHSFGVESHADIARTLAMFGGFTESLHCEGMVKLYHAFRRETGCVTKSVADDIIDCCKTVVGMEDRFIDLAFEMGPVKGMTPENIKAYIRFIADWRLRQLELPEVYGVKENPLPWLQALISGVEHANFFEARSTEYSKAATRGQWHGPDGVWSEFDRLKSERSANT